MKLRSIGIHFIFDKINLTFDVKHEITRYILYTLTLATSIDYTEEDNSFIKVYLLRL